MDETEGVRKMQDFITTFTGKQFNPTQPEPENFDIRDIAHALPLICRGNGQVKTYFSVAQHCINCAKEAGERGYSKRVQLACLLHDAGECYLSDVPRPFKQFLPEYHVYEDRILSVIYTKYLGSDITQEENALVREIDDAMLYYDLLYLLDFETGKKPEIHIDLNYDFVSFKKQECEYMKVFEHLLNT